MRSSFVLSLLAVVAPALGAPTLVPITKRAGPVKPNSYIIKFKDESSGSSVMDLLTKKFAEPGSQSSITYDYRGLYNGVAVQLQEGNNDLSSMRSMQGIASIEPDMKVSISYDDDSVGSPTSEHSEPTVDWSLSKRDSPASSLGAGALVYNIDTGVNINHNCFEGRASWGAVFGGYKQEDDNGHGTHTAGTAVGKEYGVATAANLVAIKVLGADGSGSTSDVMMGVKWAHEDFLNNKRRGVISMSLGGLDLGFGLGVLPAPLADAVANAIGVGLHCVIAAGNDNLPAKTSSPANVRRAITVGAVDSNNQKASFSNWGKLIDVWAPGVNILSAWIGSTTATNTISGTSMATPYVAGILAVVIGGGQVAPDVLSGDLKKNAKKVVKFAPEDILAQLSSNNFLAQPW